jgi:hypothetical protein
MRVQGRSLGLASLHCVLLAVAMACSGNDAGRTPASADGGASAAAGSGGKGAASGGAGAGDQVAGGADGSAAASGGGRSGSGGLGTGGSAAGSGPGGRSGDAGADGSTGNDAGNGSGGTPGAAGGSSSGGAGGSGCPPSLPSGTCWSPGDPQPTHQSCAYGTMCCGCNGGLPGPFAWQCVAVGINPAACPASPPRRGDPCSQPAACTYCERGGTAPGGLRVTDCDGSTWS